MIYQIIDVDGKLILFHEDAFRTAYEDPDPKHLGQTLICLSSGQYLYVSGDCSRLLSEMAGQRDRHRLESKPSPVTTE